MADVHRPGSLDAFNQRYIQRQIYVMDGITRSLIHFTMNVGSTILRHVAGRPRGERYGKPPLTHHRTNTHTDMNNKHTGACTHT